MIQIFKSAATAAELFALNRECASEQAKYSPGTAVDIGRATERRIGAVVAQQGTRISTTK